MKLLVSEICLSFVFTFLLSHFVFSYTAAFPIIYCFVRDHCQTLWLKATFILYLSGFVSGGQGFRKGLTVSGCIWGCSPWDGVAGGGGAGAAEGWPRLSLHVVSGLVCVDSPCGPGASSQHGSPKAALRIGQFRAPAQVFQRKRQKLHPFKTWPQCHTASSSVLFGPSSLWSGQRFKWRKHEATPPCHRTWGKDFETHLNPPLPPHTSEKRLLSAGLP